MIQRILVLIIFYGTILSAEAQNFTAYPGNTVTTYTSLEAYTTGSIKFRNDNLTDLVLGWQLLEKTVPAGWEYSYCDYPTCYTAVDMNGVMDPVAPGDSGFVKVNVIAHSEGWAHFKIRVFNWDTPSEADTVDYWFNALASVQESKHVEPITVYPNPSAAGSQITIDNLPENYKIQIVNTLGQTVERIEGNKKSLSLNTDWGKGVFFVRISNGNHQETRKIIVR
jgi:hypothetical protein